VLERVPDFEERKRYPGRVYWGRKPEGTRIPKDVLVGCLREGFGCTKHPQGGPSCHLSFLTADALTPARTDIQTNEVYNNISARTNQKVEVDGPPETLHLISTGGNVKGQGTSGKCSGWYVVAVCTDAVQ